MNRWLAHGSARTLLEMLAAGFVSRVSFLSTAQFDTARQMGQQLSKYVGPFWLPFIPTQRGSLIKKGNTPCGFQLLTNSHEWLAKSTYSAMGGKNTPVDVEGKSV